MVSVAGRWPLKVLEHRTKSTDFASWEKEFLTVFAGSLKPGDIVFDVGAEEGEFSALAAKMAGGSNVHMFEPRQQIWNNIRAVWRLNGLERPGGCWAGFASDSTSDPAPGKSAFVPWPRTRGGDGLHLHSRFESLLRRKGIPSITIDDYVDITGISPSVIAMDIEGAEVLAVRGALETLSRARPVVHVSVHVHMIPEYGCREEELFRTFSRLGYRSRLISVDHDEHWVFWDPKKRNSLPEKLPLKRFACRHIPSPVGVFMKEKCPALYFKLKRLVDRKPVNPG